MRIGTSGWNYPTGKGSWNGIFYPLPEDRERGFDELRFYSERFNTVEVNSTFYGQPRANATLGWVEADAARLRIRGEAVSEVHAPEHGDRSRPGDRRPTSTRSRAASIRWPPPASSGRC